MITCKVIVQYPICPAWKRERIEIVKCDRVEPACWNDVSGERLLCLRIVNLPFAVRGQILVHGSLVGDKQRE